jgi:hypothetical protein
MPLIGFRVFYGLDMVSKFMLEFVSILVDCWVFFIIRFCISTPWTFSGHFIIIKTKIHAKKWKAPISNLRVTLTAWGENLILFASLSNQNVASWLRQCHSCFEKLKQIPMACQSREMSTSHVLIWHL